MDVAKNNVLNLIITSNINSFESWRRFPTSLSIKELKVINPFHCSGDLKEVNTAQHYQFSSEEYKKRDDTVRSFLVKNKLGKYNEELMDKLKNDKRKLLQEEIKLANELKVGDRCEIVIPGYPRRQGTVRYVGYVHFKDGPWVGVQYDEPLGKNDGSIDGKKYFECPFKYGAFVRPSSVSAGDYPELPEDIDEI